MKRWFYLVLLLCAPAFSQTLTLTVHNYLVHQGDKVPPCNYTVTGYTGTDTWTQATTNVGYPTCSTTYTSSSAIGTYSYTASVSAVALTGSYHWAATVPGTITVEAPNGTGIQNITNVAMPSGMMPNMTVANSACSGVTAGLGDAGATTTTTNMNCWLTAGRSSPLTFGNQPKSIYLPCGVYTVNAPIVFVGAAQQIVGDGPDCTVIKLAQSTSTFSNAAAPIDFFNFEGAGASGMLNDGFNEYVANLMVDIGPGNPGANAINFIGSNFDSVRNVWVVFEDSLGACGLCMNHALPGETFVKNFATYGGGQCFRGTQESEYNTVLEDITCENQSVNAIWTAIYNIEVRNYFSFQTTTPAWTNISAGETLINAELVGSGGTTALVNGSAGTMYVRNATSSGYTNTMVDSNGPTTITGPITEHFSATAQTLWSTIPPTGIIITPVQETPLASDPPSSGWLAANPDPSTWSAQMATCPASGVFYVPVLHNYTNGSVITTSDASFTGVYTTSPPVGAITVTVPSCINHVMWNHATFVSGGTNFPVLNVTGSSATPLIIDGIGASDTKTINPISTTRTIVMEDGAVIYNCAANSTVFFEDIETQNGTVFCNNQNIFARALDNESLGGDVGISSIAYVAATNTITVGVFSVDPLITIGTAVYFNANGLGVQPSTWVWNTVFRVTNITTSPCCTLTGTWLGTHADQTTTTQTQGSYRVMPDHLACNGCNLWILGYKTEDAGPLIDVVNGNVEIDGGFWLPLRPQVPGSAAFELTDSNAFFTGQILASTEFSWNNFVSETKAGVTRNLANPNTGNATGTTLLNGFYSLAAAPSLFNFITSGQVLFSGNIH